jgi:hypothetical protein
MAENPHLPFIDATNAAYHVDGGAFACTVRSEQTENFPPMHGQGKIAHRRSSVKIFMQMSYIES